MPRTYVLVLIFLLIISSIIGVGVWYQIENPYFISGDTERDWARDRYDKALVEVGKPFPSLDPVLPSKRPEIVLDPGEITVRIEELDYEIEETGDLIRPDTGKSQVTLPDGTVISLLAVALHIPQPEDEQANPRYMSKPVTWRDPATMKALTSTEIESLEINPEPNFNRTEQLLLLLTHASKPTLWQGLNVFNARTLTKLNSGYQAYLSKNPAEWSVGLNQFFASPIDIILPISYGETETKTWDFQRDPELEFSDSLVRLHNLFAINGETSGASFGSGHASITWNPVRSADYFRQSFVIIHSEPQVQLKSILIQDQTGKRLSGDVSSGVRSITLGQPLEKVGPFSATLFPETARIHFRLPPFPEMTEYENLFDIPLPKKTIRSSYEMQGQLSSTLDLRLSDLQSINISKDEFPFEIGPDQTHADLLLSLQRMIGKPLVVNEETHRIEVRESDWIEAIKAWIKSEIFSPLSGKP